MKLKFSRSSLYIPEEPQSFTLPVEFGLRTKAPGLKDILALLPQVCRFPALLAPFFIRRPVDNLKDRIRDYPKGSISIVSGPLLHLECSHQAKCGSSTQALSRVRRVIIAGPMFADHSTAGLHLPKSRNERCPILFDRAEINVVGLYRPPVIEREQEKAAARSFRSAFQFLL